MMPITTVNTGAERMMNGVLQLYYYGPVLVRSTPRASTAHMAPQVGALGARPRLLV